MLQDASVLITGGAGYIGSHVVLALRDRGWAVIVVDNLSTGHREAVPDGVPFVEGDVGDASLISDVLAQHRPAAVMHFAGSTVAPESVSRPLDYYFNNTCASLALITTCVTASVKAFIFSSTAAVYGNPVTVPVNEEARTVPINPYGTSKLMTEWILRDAAAAATGFGYVTLRYFNIVGADPKGRAGQSTPNATNLFKTACQAALGLRERVEIFGDDYSTPDGTGIRDYIHVTDLADAHVASLDYLLKGGESRIFNCGYGHGHSVREVLTMVGDVAGTDLDVGIVPRRAGDPESVVADAGLIREYLGWRPRHDDLRFMIETSLKWERQLSAVVAN